MLTSYKHYRHSAGFTLIELIVVVIIMGIVLAIGIPQFQLWVQNTQLRTAAEGVLSGMQLARSESVRRNKKVEFVLTNPGIEGETGWTVRLLDGTVIQTKDKGEGAGKATLTATPAGATTVTFNGFGRTEATNSDGSDVLTQIDIDNTKAMTAAESREMRIVLSAGSARMCDPDPAIPVKDPRKC